MGVTNDISSMLLLLFSMVFCMSTSCAEEQEQNKFFIGRHNKDSRCDEYHIVQVNQTYALETDRYEINPPCEMYFLGIGEHNNTYGYEHMCFNILQYNVPCGVNNTVTVQAFYLNIFENETVFSISVNSTSPFHTTSFHCNDVWTADSSIHHICAVKPFILIIRMHITNPDSSFSPSIMFNTKLPEYKHEIYVVTIPYNYRVAPRDEHIMIPTYNCDCVGPVCENCIRHFVIVPESGDKVEKDDPQKISLDVNNLVTIIGGIVTSLFIPVILLLVRNYVRNNRRKGPSADKNPGDRADQLDGKDNDKNDDDNDDDDDDGTDSGSVHQNLLSSPRPSFFGSDISFHSALSTV